VHHYLSKAPLIWHCYGIRASRVWPRLSANFLGNRFHATPASACRCRSWPPSRRSDSIAAQDRRAVSSGCARRMLCHFAWCHPGKRTAFRDIARLAWTMIAAMAAAVSAPSTLRLLSGRTGFSVSSIFAEGAGVPVDVGAGRGLAREPELPDKMLPASPRTMKARPACSRARPDGPPRRPQWPTVPKGPIPLRPFIAPFNRKPEERASCAKGRLHA
jgi:hypothetical protein